MKRILLIEDDTALREELAVLLKNAGYETRSVTDFRNVIQQIKESISDLILLDVNLPGTNGETLLRELRCDSDTPVIMLTSRTDEIDEVLSMSYGADDYITKPYNPTILLLRITAVLRACSESLRARLACIFCAIFRQNPRQYTKYCLRFWLHLAQNLTARYAHAEILNRL